MNKKIKFISVTVLIGALIALLVRDCRHDSPNSQPKESFKQKEERFKEKAKTLLHIIAEKEKSIQKEVIKDTIKEFLMPPDTDLTEGSHFVFQPGIGLCYADRFRLDLDIHFWRHYRWGALVGAGIYLGSDRNIPTVKGIFAGTYTLPFRDAESVSLFLGSTERALVQLDIRKFEVVGGIRIKLPYLGD